MKEEWAIALAADTSADEFASRHDLVHVGSIPSIAVDLFQLKTDHYSKGPWKTQRQAAFETLLQRHHTKSIGPLPAAHPYSKKRSLPLEDSSGIVWFQQQELRRRDKRSVSELTLPKDPLFGQQWHLQPISNQHVSIDVFGAWEMGYHGEGVTIAICDDGFDINHPDINSNYNGIGSWNFNKGNNNTGPNSLTVDWHGTSSAGMAAARDDGTACGVGAAYRAQLSAIVILQFAEIADADEARALSYRTDVNHIYSNSWGPTDDAARKEGPKPLTYAAMEDSIRNGRGGLGSVYVWSSGNGNRGSDNCNYDGYASWRYTITVGAVDYTGSQAWYSESCSAIHFVAPSSGANGSPAQFQFVISSDLLGSNGNDRSDCNVRFSGTSAACPLAAGIVALVLQARPDLNWIEVQQVLIDSTWKTNPNDPDWTQNAAGRWVSHKYGFGLINATKAVLVARDFTNRITLEERTVFKTNNESVAFGSTPAGWGAISTIQIDEDINIRHVEVILTADVSTAIGNLKVTLTAPSGTVAILADKHGDKNKQYNKWRFTSLRSWGERSSGVWTLTVTDVLSSSLTGKISEFGVKLYGGDAIPETPAQRQARTPPTSGSVQMQPLSFLESPFLYGAPASLQTAFLTGGRVLLMIAGAVPLVLLGIWSSYSKATGKFWNGFAIAAMVTIIIIFLAVQLYSFT